MYHLLSERFPCSPQDLLEENASRLPLGKPEARPLRRLFYPEKVRSWENLVVRPETRERFSTLFPQLSRPPRLRLSPAAFPLSRARSVHFLNRAEVRNETPSQPAQVCLRADTLGPTMYASRAAGIHSPTLSDILVLHLPNGCVGIRGRRENDAPRPTRDTSAHPGKPTGQTGLGIGARV